MVYIFQRLNSGLNACPRKSHFISALYCIHLLFVSHRRTDHEFSDKLFKSISIFHKSLLQMSETTAMVNWSSMLSKPRYEYFGRTERGGGKENDSRPLVTNSIFFFFLLNYYTHSKKKGKNENGYPDLPHQSSTTTPNENKWKHQFINACLGCR